MTNEALLSRLNKPAGQIDVVLDTDAFNEVDDQFALSYLIRSPEKINLLAVYSAPFMNEKVASPKEGMERSFDEILNIATLCGREDLKSLTYRGSERFLPDEHTPVLSDAAQNLAERAMSQPEGRPLYVLAIGAITNVASALLMNPQIAEKIVLVWLGGHAHHWDDTREFNLFQDVASARVVFDSGVPMVQVPCMGVVTHLTTTGPELKHCMAGKNELCDYLYNIVVHEAEVREGRTFWSRTLWDVAAAAWLLEEGFTQDKLVHSPVVSYDGLYAFTDTRRHLIKYVTHVNRDAILKDLFEKLTR